MAQNQPKMLGNLIKPKLKQLPVTCIKFLDKHIIGAIGGDLHFYEIFDNPNLLKRTCFVNIFPSESIYGIILNDGKIIVWGGRKIALVEASRDFSCSSVKALCKAEDWILDGVSLGDSEAAFLTAHNALLLYQYFPSITLVSRISCIEKCILYSGKILNSKWTELIILAGTVHQEVIIWSSGHCVSREYPAIHHLKGHKGVIFSISFDEQTQRICSTSDDRTVKVWSVKFPPSNNYVKNWINAEVTLNFSVFGHSARVWRSVFLPNGQLISVGEDSGICTWDINGALLNRWESNGDIWCLDYNNLRVAIGGNGIIIKSTLPIPDVSSVRLSNEYGTMKNVVMSYSSKRVIVTDKGNLILYSDCIIDVVENKKFFNYCVFSISACRKYVALGGFHGDIVIFEVFENKLSELCRANISERVSALCWPDKTSIIASGIDGCLCVWKLTETGNRELICQNEYLLPLSKERWITCATLVKDDLICGDRMGSVHFYPVSNSKKDPANSLSKLHSTKGVSDIKFINGEIYSTGRDGMLRELIILDGKLIVLSTLKLPMDWPKEIFHTKTYGLIIIGFHGSNFTIWSVDDRITLLNLNCGGGHRSFDCLIDENLVINYLQMKKMKYLSCPLDRVAHKTVLAGYHKKTINCSCLLSSKNDVACILTGSEDNSVRICTVEETEWKCSSTYSRHISSVRACATVDDVLVTAGGRAQLILWNVQDVSGEIRIKEMGSHMLREESEYRRSWRNAEPLVDPETRYMDLEIIKRNDGSYTIFAGCSDGVLRIFVHDKCNNRLSLTKALETDQGCLLKLSVFEWLNEPVVVTAGTQGSVSFWHAPHDTTPKCKQPVHSSGINSMDLRVEKNHLILCTGGDDTLVILTAFSLQKNKVEIEGFSIREHVHCCQVTGLKITSEYVMSVGLDQKLFLFSWRFDGNYLKTSLCSIFNSSVQDIHGLLAWTSGEKEQMKIMVFGRGFELLHFDGSHISKS